MKITTYKYKARGSRFRFRTKKEADAYGKKLTKYRRTATMFYNEALKVYPPRKAAHIAMMKTRMKYR